MLRLLANSKYAFGFHMCDYAGLTLSNPGDLAISLGTSDTVIIYHPCFINLLLTYFP